MKRRKFFKDAGLTLGSGLIAPGSLSIEPGKETFEYAGIHTLSDATNDKGETAIRLALANSGNSSSTVKIQVKVSGNGKLSRTKDYFLEPPDQFTPQQDKLHSQLFPGDVDVLVAWIKKADLKTGVTLQLGKRRHRFILEDLLNTGELRFDGPSNLTANLLGYSEVGALEIAEMGIADSEDFRFAIMADPQGGNASMPDSSVPTRMKIHNAFIEDTVQRLYEVRPAPICALILGDFVDHQGEDFHFEKMEELIKPLRMPILLAVGNHETPYKSDFGPGYNMHALDNFFTSQKRINGTNKIAYSFNLGKWHFVVWPDPLRPNFWVNHPHYFDWLEQDLERHKDRAVVFMHHVPLHPIGIDPLTSYVESIGVKQLLLSILAKHGNVKYIFSGHVHIPLKASVKTAVSCKGMKMINLPPAGFRTRAFGEQDYFGGPEQGVCILDVKGESLTVNFQTVTKEWFTYPEKLLEFDDQKYALWLNQAWELPLNNSLMNGDFSEGLDYWHQRYVYHEDVNPSNIREVRTDADGNQSLYLYSRKRDYDVPGQDRLPQHINRITQAVSIKGITNPQFRLSYMPEKNRFEIKSLNGFFLWMECYSGSHKCANLVYSVGKIYDGITGGFGKSRMDKIHHFDLPSKAGEWHTAALPFSSDFEAVDSEGRRFEELKIDRILISMGTWTINEGMNQEVGIYVGKLSLAAGDDKSTPTPIKEKEDIWAMKLNHVAGDHQYTKQAEVYPKGLQGK